MLSVLIATHNGIDTLGRTLEQLCALVPPPGGWMLLIVNNASTDGTEELVLGFRDRLPLKYLVEPRLGKPYALNTGIEHVCGDLIVFADDDVLPDADWLVAWRSAVDRYPECSIFGGTIEPFYDHDPPDWFCRNSCWGNLLFVGSDAQPEGLMPPSGFLCGGNMAVRVAALADGTRFDERFYAGPSGLMGEERDLLYRLTAQGNKACFVPGARVRHIVQPRQLTWRWMLRRFYRFGKMTAILELQQNGSQDAEIFHVPRWRIRRIMQSAATTPIALLSCNRFRIFSHFQQIASDLGIVVQSRAVHRGLDWRELARPPLSVSRDNRPSRAGSVVN